MGPVIGGIDDVTQLWLRTHLPEAESPYLLWRDNQACVEVARRQAQVMEQRHGEMLIRANVEAMQMAALIYMAQLGTAVDHARIALEAHDIGAARAVELAARVSRLEALAVEPIGAVAP